MAKIAKFSHQLTDNRNFLQTRVAHRNLEVNSSRLRAIKPCELQTKKKRSFIDKEMETFEHNQSNSSLATNSEKSTVWTQ